MSRHELLTHATCIHLKCTQVSGRSQTDEATHSPIDDILEKAETNRKQWSTKERFGMDCSVS